MREKDIRRYLLDQMPDDERSQFEREVQNDASLRNSLEEFKETRKAILLHERNELKEQLKQLEEQLKPKKKRFPLAIAAGILVLIGIGSLFYLNNATDTSETVFTAYYEPYPNVHAPITRDADTLSTLETAFASYENRKYSSAKKQFIALLQKDENADIQFYLAITYIQLKELDKAEQILVKIDPSETRYYPQVLWYGALLDIKKGRNVSAKQKLKTLQKKNTGYKKKATEKLLKQL